MDIHYLNLTNGLEYLEEMKSRGISFSYIRIPSTVLEKNDWYRLFQCIPDDMLMHLAVGNSVYVYDCGCRRRASKTIFFGIPVIKHAIERLWHDDFFENQHSLPLRLKKIKQCPTTMQCERIFQEVFCYSAGCDTKRLGDIKAKYTYFKRFLPPQQVSVYVYGVSRQTDHDGDREHFKQILNSGGCDEIFA